MPLSRAGIRVRRRFIWSPRTARASCHWCKARRLVRDRVAADGAGAAGLVWADWNGPKMDGAFITFRAAVSMPSPRQGSAAVESLPQPVTPEAPAAGEAADDAAAVAALLLPSQLSP